MLKIGILADRDEDREAIAHVIELLTAREGFECFVYSIYEENNEDWKQVSCVILAWRDVTAAFHHAELLWQMEPALLIIYAAHRVEDIFAALGMPFFHMVRFYDFLIALPASPSTFVVIRSSIGMLIISCSAS